MPVVVDNIQSASTGDLLTVVVSGFVVGSGDNRLLIVGVSMNNHATNGPSEVLTVTFGVDSLARSGFVENLDDARAEIWYLVNPSSVEADITVTVDANVSAGWVVGAISFFGVDQLAPISGAVSNIGTSITPNVIVPSSYRELVVDVLAVETIDGATGSVGEGQTERWSIGVQTSYEVWGACSTQPGEAAAAMTWLSDDISDDWAIIAVAIRASTSYEVEGFGRQRARLELFDSLTRGLSLYDASLSPMTRCLAYFGLDYLNQRWMWTYEGQGVTDDQWAEIEQYLDIAFNEIWIPI